MAQQIDLRLKFDREAADLVKAWTAALLAVARALDTSAADQALIVSKLGPIADRLDRLNVPPPKK